MVRHQAQNVASRPRTKDIHIAEDTDFKSMLLPQPILHGLKKCGYIKPSPIQKKALPLVRCGFDLVVQAKAGTGKTCVFTVAVLELVKPNLPHLQAIVLAPTREIALQITGVISAIGQCIKGLKVGCFIGGSPLSADMEKVRGCHVAVAAPGRLKHLLDKGLLNPTHVRLLVLDEADKLLEKVFLEEINSIFEKLPESKQVLACSATYTDYHLEILSRYMNGGQYVTPQYSLNKTVLLGVRQFVSVISRHVDKLAQLKMKEKHLLHILQSVPFNQCLVFSNLHCRAASLATLLRKHGWGAEWIAGRQKQLDRVAALSQLRDQRVRVLVTTDLTARGVDVEQVNLVVNLDLPKDHHTYLHRMGRAGRYGSHGIVITVVSAGQELTAFQELIGKIGGTAHRVNRVPENLKNVDLWTMSNDKFEQIEGINNTLSLDEKSKVTSKTSAKKCTLESSDSEGYVKEYKVENNTALQNGAVKSVEEIESLTKSSTLGKKPDCSSTSSGEKCSPESSDSEDYVKEYKRENGAVTSGKFENKTAPGFVKMYRQNTTVTSEKTDDGTSTDEKFSRESSDSVESLEKLNNGESLSSENPCVCNLYEPDPSDIKVIAGPSLFALKKEEQWREVLPVIVNESKVPLNTPIALLDSKLIRVRFWDKTQICDKDTDVEISCEKVINFDAKCRDKHFLSFEEIVSSLENGFRCKDPMERVYDCEDNAKQFLSFESIEDAFESGFCAVDGNNLVNLNEVEQVLKKFDLIKKQSESVLINFDSFDLVGWLAVDELHNIIEEISIDKCEVFEFNLVTCLAGKQHIEVLSPTKGSSKEAHDYIDHITTINIERLPLTKPFSLSNIAQQIAQMASNPSDILLGDVIDSKIKQYQNKVKTEKEASGYNVHCVIKESSLLKNVEKVPITDSKKSVTKKVLEQESKGRRKRNTSTSKQRNEKGNKTGSTFNRVTNSKNESTVLPQNKKFAYKEQSSKYNKKGANDCEHVSFESLQAALKIKHQDQNSPEKSVESESGSYVDMTFNPTKDVQTTVNTNPGSIVRKSVQSQLSKDCSSILDSLGDESKALYQCILNDLIENSNDFEHLHKHRDSDNSYDSCDTVDYETTDLDKKMYYLEKKQYCRLINECGAQPKKCHLTNEKDSTNGSLKESYDSHDYHNPELIKPTVLYTKLKKSKHHKELPKSSIEAENSKVHSKNSHEGLNKKEQRNKSRHRHNDGKLKTALNTDTQESYKESYDSYNSIDSEISKLKELNTKLVERESKRKNFNHNNQFCEETSEDSSESDGTNRHSFRTACSQNVSEDLFHRRGACSRVSRLSNQIYDNTFEIPPQTYHRPQSVKKYSAREQSRYRSCRREEVTAYQSQQESSQNFPNESASHNHFEPYQTSNHQNQDFFDAFPTTQIRGENLHGEWYSRWYLQVRQRAIQLAMMEYTNIMSTQ